MSAAAGDGKDSSTLTVDRFFEVTRGAISPMSAGEWFAKSGVNQGARL